MKLIYLDETYECIAAKKKQNEIVIYTGNIVDGEEVVYHIYGDIDFDAVKIEGGEWTRETTDAERIAELEKKLESK